MSWNDPNRQLAPSEKSKTLNVLVPGIGFVYEFNSDVEFLEEFTRDFLLQDLVQMNLIYKTRRKCKY
ncbi:MAG: hypothetical protein Ct9H300mP29_2150 [Candidatus Neomarinimicrobiota bacterium]|nr:MAG: hypothetical protein Ct9H300mP29_2150 [Candidatus Neomarinimicrobiota bacterium]